MPATVITGVFVSSQVVFGASVNNNGLSKGLAVVGNTTNIPQTYTGVTITGDTFGIYSVPAGQFPVVVNPGQSAIIEIDINPDTKGGISSATATVNTQTAFAPQLTLSSPLGAVLGQPTFTFPTTKVGQTSTFANAQLINNSAANITVTALGFAAGTDFFIVGAPVVPFTLNAFTASAVFSIQFTPTTTGSRVDTLQVTETGLGITGSVYQGVGSTLQSAFNLTGGAQNMLFAFIGAGGVNPILSQVANSLNTEEPGSFVRLHDFGLVNQEKQVMRIRGHYEDIGSGTLSFKCRSRRVNKPDEIITVAVNIGVFGDGWIREFTSEPTPITGELVQITVSRAANSGPVSLIDYTPEFDPKGAVIGGT